MEKFEHDIPKILTTDKASAEMTLDQDKYIPEKLYIEQLNSIHSRILDIATYVEAKESEPILARLLSDLITMQPSQTLKEQEILSELQRCELIISFYEKKSINKKSLEELQKEILDLQEKIIKLSDLQSVAKNSPKLN